MGCAGLVSPKGLREGSDHVCCICWCLLKEGTPFYGLEV